MPGVVSHLSTPARTPAQTDSANNLRTAHRKQAQTHHAVVPLIWLVAYAWVATPCGGWKLRRIGKLALYQLSYARET